MHLYLSTLPQAAVHQCALVRDNKKRNEGTKWAAAPNCIKWARLVILEEPWLLRGKDYYMRYNYFSITVAPIIGGTRRTPRGIMQYDTVYIMTDSCILMLNDYFHQFLAMSLQISNNFSFKCSWYMV